MVRQKSSFLWYTPPVVLMVLMAGAVLGQSQEHELHSGCPQG